MTIVFRLAPYVAARIFIYAVTTFQYNPSSIDHSCIHYIECKNTPKTLSLNEICTSLQKIEKSINGNHICTIESMIYLSCNKVRDTGTWFISVYNGIGTEQVVKKLMTTSSYVIVNHLVTR